MLDRVWDRIEIGMEYINKNGANWILDNQDKIYGCSLIITVLMIAVAWYTRGYFAAGGEIFFPIIPWVVIKQVELFKGDDEDEE